jgi:hypothetical protein
MEETFSTRSVIELSVFDCITKLCGQQAEVTQNYENVNVRNTGKGEQRHRKYERLKLGGGQVYYRSSD